MLRDERTHSRNHRSGQRGEPGTFVKAPNEEPISPGEGRLLSFGVLALLPQTLQLAAFCDVSIIPPPELTAVAQFDSKGFDLLCGKPTVHGYKRNTNQLGSLGRAVGFWWHESDSDMTDIITMSVNSNKKALG